MGIAGLVGALGFLGMATRGDAADAESVAVVKWLLFMTALSTASLATGGQVSFMRPLVYFNIDSPYKL